jgi:hypothetical protein
VTLESKIKEFQEKEILPKFTLKSLEQRIAYLEAGLHDSLVSQSRMHKKISVVAWWIIIAFIITMDFLMLGFYLNYNIEGRIVGLIADLIAKNHLVV